MVGRHQGSATLVLALEEPGDRAEQRVGRERLGEHVPRHVRVGKARYEQDGLGLHPPARERPEVQRRGSRDHQDPDPSGCGGTKGGAPRSRRVCGSDGSGTEEAEVGFCRLVASASHLLVIPIPRNLSVPLDS